jgi:hypothetical protein
MLIDLLSSQKDAEAKILNAELVVRRSTCRVGNQQNAGKGGDGKTKRE